MKKTLYFLLTVAVIVAGIRIFLPAQSNQSIEYIALGDSIAEGYIATEMFGYPDMLNQYFQEKYQRVVFENFARSGDQSGDLLALLETPAVREAVAKSGVITVSIGGNDLLSGIYQLAQGNFFALNDKVQTFSRQFKEIAKILRELNPKAGVYVLNLYNPLIAGKTYYGITCDETLKNLADSYIQKINRVLAEESLAEEFDFTLIDAYSVFTVHKDSGEELFGIPDYVDVHPNDRGHELIFQLHLEKLKEEGTVAAWLEKLMGK